ncbi:MAG: hypothetical protein M1836_003864 [Candelina mexicana]|nr:MAG: hypothetical protein M1836_003864 [Candelina mexicana]
MTDATPRINAHYLDSFQGQTIRILGKVTQLRGEQATIDAAGNVTVILNRVQPPKWLLTDSHLILNNAIEIIGKVNSDLTVKVLSATDFGNNLDYAAVDSVVEATHRYKEIFYEGTD